MNKKFSALILLATCSCFSHDYIDINNSKIKEFCINNAPGRIVSLIRADQVREAEEYVNKLLEYWKNQTDEEVRKHLRSLLKMAIMIESEHYYSKLKEKSSKVLNEEKSSPNFFIEEHEPYFQTISLGGDNSEGLCMIEVLASKMKMDPEYRRRYKFSAQDLRQSMEFQLYDLSKRMHYINSEEASMIFDVLHIAAIHSLQHPHRKIYLLLNKTEPNQDWVGLYEAHFEITSHIVVMHSIMEINKFQGTLMHEFTHNVMDILFNNACNPYWSANHQNHEELKNAYNAIVKGLLETLDSPKNELSASLDYAIERMNSVKTYDEKDKDSEYIVRIVQIMAAGHYNDPEVKKLLQPFVDYWIKYISPEIKRYIRAQSQYDKFRSDWQREYLFDPFYEKAISLNLVDTIHNLISQLKFQKAYDVAVQKIENGDLTVPDIQIINQYFKEAGEEEKGRELKEIISKKDEKETVERLIESKKGYESEIKTMGVWKYCLLKGKAWAYKIFQHLNPLNLFPNEI